MGHKRRFISILLLFFATIASAQKVGLVLSGGGAKGCTHVGVIKALEENNIPIDYVAGTSMGAIIGSLYAMGYTPQEMEDLLLSNEFETWLKGQIDDKYKFYFKEEEETPEFVSFKLSIDDSLTVKPLLPTSFIAPHQMNQACMFLFAQSTTACNGDFNQLFVPFRCVSADINTKSQYVHRKGDLSDAVRTSMSFPFVFKPIRVNNHLMLDGGMYNNFPIDIMKEELKADYIIGSSVSANPSTAEGDDPLVLLENLIMQKTNYNLKEKDGTLIEFHYTDVNLLDFYKAKELIQIGYDSTIAHIDKIKSKISRRVSLESLNIKRKKFNDKKPPLVFKNIIINGINPQQEKFIIKSFHDNDEKFDFQSFLKTYFKLLSDKKIAEIIPHAQYNKKEEAYDLILDIKINDHFKLSMGGNISSTTSNQLYVGFKYVGIRHWSYDFAIDGQIGMLYNDAHAQARIDFPYKFPFSIKLIGDINHYIYSSKQYAFFETDIPTEAYSTELHTKAKFSIPVLQKGEANTGVGYGIIKTKYHGPFSTGENEFDHTKYHLGTVLFQYNNNSLSHKQYPISGTKARITTQYIFGNKLASANTMIDSISFGRVDKRTKTDWLLISGSFDHFIPINKHFSFGLLAETAFSTNELEDNYIETLLMSPSFTPTKHSKLIFNPALHANIYFALGAKPIYIINNFLHLRFENYLYIPEKPIIPTARFSAAYDRAFSRLYFLSELTAVAQLRYFTVGIYGNYYSYPRKNWNAGLNIGYLLFHDKLIE